MSVLSEVVNPVAEAVGLKGKPFEYEGQGFFDKSEAQQQQLAALQAEYQKKLETDHSRSAEEIKAEYDAKISNLKAAMEAHQERVDALESSFRNPYLEAQQQRLAERQAEFRGSELPGMLSAAARGEGPAQQAAQAQMRANLDAAMRAQLSAAKSAYGRPGATIRAALGNIAAMSQQAAGQSAMMRGQMAQQALGQYANYEQFRQNQLDKYLAAGMSLEQAEAQSNRELQMLKYKDYQREQDRQYQVAQQNYDAEEAWRNKIIEGTVQSLATASTGSPKAGQIAGQRASRPNQYQEASSATVPIPLAGQGGP